MIDAFFRAIERSGFGHRRSRRWLLKWGATLGGLTAISNRFGLPSRAPAAILNDHDRAQIKMKTQTHIAVIGAGAFGGWTALYLLRRGARVTLIDSWGPGNSRASSGGEARVIRGTYGPNQPYTEMAARAIQDRKSTRLNSSHRCISYAVFCLKKKKPTNSSPVDAQGN